jgi:hypothetical protein
MPQTEYGGRETDVRKPNACSDITSVALPSRQFSNCSITKVALVTQAWEISDI